MPAQEVNRAKLAELVERDLEGRLPTSGVQDGHHPTHQICVRFIKQQIKSFAPPPNPHVELGAERLADALQAPQSRVSDHSALGVGDELTRDVRGRGKVELAQTLSDPDDPDRATDAEAIHGEDPVSDGFVGAYPGGGLRGGLREERAPAGLVGAGGHAVRDPDEREMNEALVDEEALGELGVGHRQVAEAGVAPEAALGVGEGAGAETVDEAAELAGGDGLAAQVDDLRFDAALAEESDRGAGLAGVVATEDLDEDRGRRGLAGHGAAEMGVSSTIGIRTGDSRR